MKAMKEAGIGVHSSSGNDCLIRIDVYSTNWIIASN